MAVLRGPAEFTIITPALSLNDLKNLVEDFEALQSAAGTIIIRNADQLEQATINIEEMYENNMTQASMSPFGKTKVGLTSNAQISIAEDKISFMSVATNATEFLNAGQLELIGMGDDSGLTTGSSELPYRTVIIRPYVGKIPDPNPLNWFIFPFAGIEGRLNLAFSLQSQRAYNMEFTAYDPQNSGRKVLRGKPSLIDSTVNVASRYIATTGNIANTGLDAGSPLPLSSLPALVTELSVLPDVDVRQILIAPGNYDISDTITITSSGISSTERILIRGSVSNNYPVITCTTPEESIFTLGFGVNHLEFRNLTLVANKAVGSHIFNNTLASSALLVNSNAKIPYLGTVVNANSANIATSGITVTQYAVLDTFDYGIAMAFSVERLYEGYTGPCLRIKREDDAELDIGFTANGMLDVVTVQGFIGAQDHEIVAFYDQSSVASNFVAFFGDVKIVVNGLDSKPALLFNNSALNRTGGLGASNGIPNAQVVLNTAQISTANETRGMFAFPTGPGSSTRLLAGTTSNGLASAIARRLDSDAANQVVSSQFLQNGTRYTYCVDADYANARARIFMNELQAIDTGPGGFLTPGNVDTTNTTFYRLGSNSGAFHYYNGYIADLVFQVDQPSENRSALRTALGHKFINR